MSTASTPPGAPGAPQRGWSKQNLRAGERTAWTRGQDGGAGGGSAMDGAGQVRWVLVLSAKYVSGATVQLSFIIYFPSLFLRIRIDADAMPCLFFCFAVYPGSHTHSHPTLTHSTHLDHSSNLTFSLAPGWAFVETEDWRKDIQCAWAPCSGDPGAFVCGWVYCTR